MGVCDSAGDQVQNVVSQGKNTLKGLLYDKEKYADFSETAFNKYDLNNNGYIDQNELQNLIDDLSKEFKEKYDVSEDTIKAILEKLDTDNDGRISKEEFTKGSRLNLLKEVSLC